MVARPQRSTLTDKLCPYTTLLRSDGGGKSVGRMAHVGHSLFQPADRELSGISRKRAAAASTRNDRDSRMARWPVRLRQAAGIPARVDPCTAHAAQCHKIGRAHV